MMYGSFYPNSIKYMKRYLTSLVIQGMQIKTTMRYFHTPIRITEKKKNNSTNSQFFFFRNNPFFFKKLLFILFIYFWLRWVFVAARGLSLVAVSRGYSSLRCVGFSLGWLLLLRSVGSRRTGFSSYAHGLQWLWHTGSRVQAQ